MKSFYFLLFAAFLISCNNQNTETASAPQEEESVVGTWDLVSFIDPDNSEEGWKQHGPNIIYQKHLTETHFTWVQYDTEAMMLLGMGGGNYDIVDGKYVENIAFFYPPASSELGQTIPFDVEFKEGKWYHTGFAKNMEIDFKTGEMVPGDSTKIEEIWQRSTAQNSLDQGLFGTWVLKQYRDNQEDSYYEYPEMTGYIKLITPSHFAWIKYDKDGDQIYGAGAGTYSFNGERYTENIEMMFPKDGGMRGKSIDFSLDLSAYKWQHLGEGLRLTDEGEPDTFLIDEVWTAHVNTIEETVGVSF